METKKFEDLEIWDHIKGYEGLYKVSSKGRVFSLKNNKYLKPRHSHGYYTVDLYKDCKKKTHKIHRLTALTFYFVEDDDETKEVDHIDRDRTNNNLLNLRFCTRSENMSNIGIKQNNKSGYKGVRLDNRNKKWVSRIRINGKNTHLGYFNTKEEAYNAYK